MTKQKVMLFNFAEKSSLNIAFCFYRRRHSLRLTKKVASVQKEVYKKKETVFSF